MAFNLEFFERVSVMYKAQHMDPWWDWYDAEPGPRRGLALFLGQYAYERQGRSRSYPHAAYFAVTQGSQSLDAPEIWLAFKRELAGGKLNEMLNPLNHARPGCKCARCTFADTSGQLLDVVEVTRSFLVAGQVWRAYDHVKQVRGVGPKVASFFLRDLAVKFQITPPRNRELLQPIDVWVRRVAEYLNGGTSLNDQETASWVCQKFAQPEVANQGLWYFSSQIAASEVKLCRALDNEEYANEITERYVKQLQSAANAWLG
jgi:hypothetical protein